MKKFHLALDLKDDPSLIKEYENLHRAVWPAVIDSIKASGITRMEIFRTGSRLVMEIEASDDFTFERKAALDASNREVQEWEKLMWKFQQPLPESPPGVKWVPMQKIFEL